MLVSRCCREPVKVVSSEDCSYYCCNRCHCPTDAIEDKESITKEIGMAINEIH